MALYCTILYVSLSVSIHYPYYVLLYCVLLYTVTTIYGTVLYSTGQSVRQHSVPLLSCTVLYATVQCTLLILYIWLFTVLYCTSYSATVTTIWHCIELYCTLCYCVYCI